MVVEIIINKNIMNMDKEIINFEQIKAKLKKNKLVITKDTTILYNF